MNVDPISVSDLNKYVKNMISSDEYLENVLVKGEISNFKHHYTGHFYFTLKDEKSLIKCVMFKSYAEQMKFEPKDGMKVIVYGTVSVFERDGVYQIYAKQMQEDGMGNLYLAYEELKAKLEKEGLFDESHKKKIPFMPDTIGVLTSNTGAVIKDIINVATRRNPNVHIRLLPVPVQGKDAFLKIVDAINIMNEKNLADVIILARGGGSLEDLWPFNEEPLARAIYDSRIPIVSAVGHETDYTIADFVSDLRAPTPSAAAELVVGDVADIKYTLDVHEKRLKTLLKSKVENMRLRLEKCMNSRVYKDPLKRINDNYLALDSLNKDLVNFELKRLDKEKQSFKNLNMKLDNLSPLKTLGRGYSIVIKKSNGKVLKNAKDVKKGEKLDIKLNDGNVNAIVE